MRSTWSIAVQSHNQLLKFADILIVYHKVGQIKKVGMFLIFSIFSLDFLNYCLPTSLKENLIFFCFFGFSILNGSCTKRLFRRLLFLCDRPFTQMHDCWRVSETLGEKRGGLLLLTSPPPPPAPYIASCSSWIFMYKYFASINLCLNCKVYKKNFNQIIQWL